MAAWQSGCAGLVGANSSGGGPPPALAISSPTASAESTTKVNVSWATNQPATSQVEYGTTTNYGSSTAVDSTMVTNHQASVSNLKAGTLYHVRIHSQDASNNEAVSSDLTVTTSTTPDTTPPTGSISSPAGGSTVSGTITVAANASDNVGVASVQFQLDGANLGSLDTASPYSVSWNTTTASNGSHTLRAIAKDAAGNSTTSANVTLTVNNTTPDTTAPTVSISSPANGASVSGTITVSANASDNVGVASVQFQLDGANLGSLDTASPYSVSWNTTTASNGSHTLRAIAKDAAANSTTSGSVTVTVNNAADTSAPSVPAGLSATAASPTQINLSWTASSDNVGVTGYRIYRAGSQVGTSSTTSFQNPGLSASTSYTYTVAAYDAVGNVSAQSASASATTLAQPSGGGIPSSLGWFQIPNTKLSSVCPSGVTGNTGCAAVISAWNSGTADTKRNQLFFTGGGHSDYAGNEVYALDLSNLTMKRLNNPSPSDSDCGESYSDGTPTSRHTYGGLTYIPSVDKVYLHGGSKYPCGSGSVGTWLFDLPTLKWALKDPVSGTAVSQDCCNYQSFAAYDPNSDAVYYVDDGTFWKYVAGTNMQTKLLTVFGIGNHISAVIDPTNKLFLVFGDGQAWQANIGGSSPALTEIDGQTSGCSSLQNSNYPGLAYDPVQNVIVAWTGGSSVFLYNAATKSCTAQSFSGGPGAAQSNGTFGRFQYFPALGVFALVNDWQQDAWTLRLTPGSGGGTPTAPVLSGIGASSISTSSFAVNWTTDVLATSQVDYGTSTSYGSSTPLNSSLVTSHTVTLTGLQVGTLYHYRVRSKDSSGTESVSGDFSVATNNTTDTTAPTVAITSPSSGASVLGTVNVTASASDNVGVVGVQFLLDGSAAGAEDTASPFSLAWNTTSAVNGAHALAARARDTAGNTTTSTSVSVTVNNASASNALQDFQARCAAPGVIACNGFDSAADFQHGTGLTGLYPDASGGYTKAIMDTSITASGAGALQYKIDPFTPANVAGYYRQQFGQSFGPRSTFYVQYRFRVSPEMLNQNWGDSSGNTSWKQSIFHYTNKTCASVELTTTDRYTNSIPMMYTDCGGRGLFTNNGIPPYLIQQGDTPTTGYNCAYSTNYATDPNCFRYVPNIWMTFYYKVSIGDWGVSNSTIQAWVGLPGQPLQEVINIQNFRLDVDTVGNNYDSVDLLNYMTGKNATLNHPTAFTWYDELIVSNQAIATPKF